MLSYEQSPTKRFWIYVQFIRIANLSIKSEEFLPLFIKYRRINQGSRNGEFLVQAVSFYRFLKNAVVFFSVKRMHFYAINPTRKHLCDVFFFFTAARFC